MNKVTMLRNKFIIFKLFHVKNIITMTTGELISVRPNLLAWLPQLFVVNERVALTGNYQNKNFLSVVAVGATNVGSVRVYHDEVKIFCLK